MRFPKQRRNQLKKAPQLSKHVFVFFPQIHLEVLRFCVSACPHVGSDHSGLHVSQAETEKTRLIFHSRCFFSVILISVICPVLLSLVLSNSGSLLLSGSQSVCYISRIPRGPMWEIAQILIITTLIYGKLNHLKVAFTLRDEDNNSFTYYVSHLMAHAETRRRP